MTSNPAYLTIDQIDPSELENEKNSEVYKEVSKFFPDSELIDVSETNE